MHCIHYTLRVLCIECIMHCMHYSLHALWVACIMHCMHHTLHASLIACIMHRMHCAWHAFVEFHKIHFNSTKNTSATLTFVRNNFASKIRLVRKYLKGPEVQNIINGLWTVLGWRLLKIKVNLFLFCTYCYILCFRLRIYWIYSFN